MNNDLPFWVRHCLAVSSDHRLVCSMYAPGKYQATLEFVGQSINGHGVTPAAALQNLDDNLQEDAAQEMIEAGVV